MAAHKHPVANSPLIESKLDIEPGAGTVDVLTIMGFGDDFPANPADGYLWSLTSKEKNPIYVYDAASLTWIQVGCDNMTVRSNVLLAHSLVISVKNERDGSAIPGASVYTIGPHELLRYGSLLQTSQHGQVEFTLVPTEDLSGNPLDAGKTQFYVRVEKKDYTSYSGTFYTSTSDITSLEVYLKWLFDTPNVLTLTWTDESDDHYARSFGEYKFDKLEFEKYSYRYFVFQMEPEGTNSSVDVAMRSIINISDELPENYRYKFMHHKFAVNGDYKFSDFLQWEDYGEGIISEPVAEFDLNLTYKQFDVVKLGGLYYRANSAVPSVAVSNSEVWEQLPTSKYMSGTYYDEGSICWVAQPDGTNRYYVALTTGRLALPDSAADIGDWAFVYSWPHENRDWQQNELALSGGVCYRAKTTIQGTEPGSSSLWSEYDTVYNHERDYAKGDVAIFQKVWYEAKEDILSRAPSRSPKWKPIVSTGDFSLGHQYKANELVEFRGAFYRARFDSANIWPYDYNFWIPLRVINSDSVHNSANLYGKGFFTTYFPGSEAGSSVRISGLPSMYDSDKDAMINPNGTYTSESSNGDVISQNIWIYRNGEEVFRLRSFNNSGQQGWHIFRELTQNSYQSWTSPTRAQLAWPWEQWPDSATNLGGGDGAIPTDNCVYRARVDIARNMPFTPSQWDQCAITDQDLEFRSYKTYRAGALCIAPKDGKVQSYQALRESTEAYPPNSPEDWKETTPILNGDVIICTLIYNSRSSYEVGDWVYFNGSFYEAVEASSNNTPFNNLSQWQIINAFSRQLNYAKKANVMVGEAKEVDVPVGACYTSKLPTLGNVWDSNSQYYKEFYDSSAYGHFNNSFWETERNWLSDVYVHLNEASSNPAWAYKPIAGKIPASTFKNPNLWKLVSYPEMNLNEAYHLEDHCWSEGKLYECMEEGALGSAFGDIKKWQEVSFHEFSEVAEYTKGDLVRSAEGEVWQCINSTSYRNISPGDNGYNSRSDYTATDWNFYQTAWFWWTKNLPESIEDYSPDKTYFTGDFVRFPYTDSNGNVTNRVYKLQNAHACPSLLPGKNGFWSGVPAYSITVNYEQGDSVYSNDYLTSGTFKALVDVPAIEDPWGEKIEWFESAESPWKIFLQENYDIATEFKAGDYAWDRSGSNSSSLDGYYFQAKVDIDNRYLNSEIYWEKADSPVSYNEKSNYAAGTSVMTSMENTWFRVPLSDIVSVHPQVNTELWENLGRLYTTSYWYGGSYNTSNFVQWNGYLMKPKENLSNLRPQYESNSYWKRIYSYDEKASYTVTDEDGLINATVRSGKEREFVLVPKKDLPSNHRAVSNTVKGVPANEAFWDNLELKTYKTYLSFVAGEAIFKKYSNSENYYTYTALQDIPILRPMIGYYAAEGEASPNGWRYLDVFSNWFSYSKGTTIAAWYESSDMIPDDKKLVYRAKQNIPITAPSNTDYWAEIFDYDSTKSYNIDDFVMVDRGYNSFDIYRALSPSTGIHPDSSANEHGTYWEKRSQTHWTYHDTNAYPIYSVIKIDGYDNYGTIEHFFRYFPFDFRTWYTGRSRFWYAIQQVPSSNPLTANAEFWEPISAPEWDSRNDYAIGSYVHCRHNNSTNGQDDCLYEDYGYGYEQAYNGYWPRFFVASELIVSNNVIYNTTDNADGPHANFWRKERTIGYYSHISDYAVADIVDDTGNSLDLTSHRADNLYYFQTALRNVISNDQYYNDRTYSGSHEIFWEGRNYKAWSETADYAPGEFTYADYPAMAKVDVISNHISYADGVYTGSHPTFWTNFSPYRSYGYLSDYEEGTYVNLDYQIYKSLGYVLSNHWDYYRDTQGNPNPNYPNHAIFWEQRTVEAYDCGKNYAVGDMVVLNRYDLGSGDWHQYSNHYYTDSSFPISGLRSWTQNNSGAMFRCIKSFNSNVVGKSEFWVWQQILPYSFNYDSKFDYSTEDVIEGYVRQNDRDSYFDALLKPKAPIESAHLIYNDKPYEPPEYGYDQYESYVIVRNMYDSPAEIVFDIVLGKQQDNENNTKTARFYIQVDRAIALTFWSYNGFLQITVANYSGNQPGMIAGLEGFNQFKPWIKVEVDGALEICEAPDDWYDYGGSSQFEFGWTAKVAALNGYNYPKSATLVSGPPHAAVVRQSHPNYDNDFRWLKTNHAIFWDDIGELPDHDYSNDYNVGDIVRYSGATWICAKPIVSNSVYLTGDRAKWEKHKVYVYDYVGSNFDYDSVRDDRFIPANEPLISPDGGYSGWGVTRRKVISYSLDKTKYWFCYFVQGAFSMYKEGFEKIVSSFPDEEPLTVGLFIDTSGSIESPARVFRNVSSSDIGSTIYVRGLPGASNYNVLYRWFKQFALNILKLQSGFAVEYKVDDFTWLVEDNVLLANKGFSIGVDEEGNEQIVIDSEGVTEDQIVSGKEAGTVNLDTGGSGSASGGANMNTLPMPTENTFLLFETADQAKWNGSNGSVSPYLWETVIDTKNSASDRELVAIDGTAFPADGFKSNNRLTWTEKQQIFIKDVTDKLRERYRLNSEVQKLGYFFLRYRWMRESDYEDTTFPTVLWWKINADVNAPQVGCIDYPTIFYPVWQPTDRISDSKYQYLTFQFLQEAPYWDEYNPRFEWCQTDYIGCNINYTDNYDDVKVVNPPDRNWSWSIPIIQMQPEELIDYSAYRGCYRSSYQPIADSTVIDPDKAIYTVSGGTANVIGGANQTVTHARYRFHLTDGTTTGWTYTRIYSGEEAHTGNLGSYMSYFMARTEAKGGSQTPSRSIKMTAKPDASDETTWMTLEAADSKIIYAQIAMKNEYYDFQSLKGASNDLETYIKWLFDTYPNVQMVIPKTSQDERWLEWTRSFIEDFRVTVEDKNIT